MTPEQFKTLIPATLHTVVVRGGFAYAVAKDSEPEVTQTGHNDLLVRFDATHASAYSPVVTDGSRKVAVGVQDIVALEYTPVPKKDPQA